MEITTGDAMKIGMLWRDADSKRTLADKLQRAVHYYRDKYGAMPNTCYVNAGMLPTGALPGFMIDGIKMVASRYQMMDNFWIGVEPAP